MFNTSNQEWAEILFGSAKLGDPRRTKRLTKMAADMAANADKSIVKACSDPASIEGAYRFIRNSAVDVNDISEAAYQYTDEVVSQCKTVLALQDTTGLSYRHNVCNDLGEVNSALTESKNPVGRTLYAHSTLMLNAESEQVIGLGNQHYWYRETKQTDKTHRLQTRPREEKESFKWQRNIETLSQRLPTMDNVIDVSDREADIYEYLDYQQTNNHRFVVRANDNRQLVDENKKLFEVIECMEAISTYDVPIQQRGGRKARTARMAMSYMPVTLRKPQRAQASEELQLNVIVCQEINSTAKSALRWILYTSEDIKSPEDARQIVRYYELRWRIEEFHKIWKTEGTSVESLRMQSRENLQKVAVIQAFIAVRLFQLRELCQNNKQSESISCLAYFTELSWKILWRKSNKGKDFPSVAPSLNWAYYALARLGGWYDSKRTGRVGMIAIWDGWIKLMLLVGSYEELQELDL